MDFLNLPAHHVAIEHPAPSMVDTGPDGVATYRWMVSDSERAHIAEMLSADVSTLSIRGNTMLQERSVCRGCGKYSGLDDLVHNALYTGVHSASFMVDVLVNGPKSGSPAHELVCSHCLTQHEGSFRWADFW